MSYHSNKYYARKIIVNGETYDSKKEHARWLYLQEQERNGEISELQRQVKFELIPSQRIDGRVVERACSYYADFVYKKDGLQIVEDVKSPATRKAKDYIIKRKLMLYLRGVRIMEV